MKRISVVVTGYLLVMGLTSCSDGGSGTSAAGTADRLVQAIHDRPTGPISRLAEQLVEEEDYAAVPILIGVIDADNSYGTVYGVGYFVLRPITGVEYSVFHDGAWWRRWWEANRRQFPDEVETIPIPVLEKTRHGRQYRPFPEDIDTLQGKLRLAAEVLDVYRRKRPDEAGRFPSGRHALREFANEVARHEDPHAIPYLIGLAEADKYAIYMVRPALGKLAGVQPVLVEVPPGEGDVRDKTTGLEYRDRRDAAWWRQWWQESKSKHPADVQAIEIPDYRGPLTFAWKEPTEEEKRQAAEEKRQAALADVADIPAVDLEVEKNPRMRYFLIGPKAKAAVPNSGFKLVVVMPGGDGGEDFHPFVRRLYKKAMNDEFLVAQPVAFKWRPLQKTVWPTRINPVAGQEFSTEDFVEAVIRDVARRYPLDKRCVFTLSWSSSGPAAYALALKKETPIKGSYVAMSVYRPQWHPPVANAKDRLFLLDHSPEDRVCKYQHAEQAKRELSEAGANVRLVTYKGGHGWRGPIYERVRDGLSWLVRQAEERDR